MATLWRLYSRALNKHPWKIQAASTGIIMACGDLTAQLVVEKKSTKDMDIVRTAKFGTLGLIMVGPGLRSWYLVLDRIAGGGSKGTLALKKMVLDQTIYAPVFLACFIAVLGALQNQNMEQIKLKYKQDYVDIMKANWMLWPAVQIVNFYIVPFQHRVLVANITSYFWNTYLAWKANRNVAY